MSRDLRGAAGSTWDLLVVGGGFYGAMLTLEAARRGLSTLLLDRDDFGGATSANSLRIVHGGLRYLQSFDLRRFRESVAERRWFLRSFPDLVRPLPCLMPLYDPPRGGRLRRPAVFRLALAANERLSHNRELPPGRVLDSAETIDLFPAVDQKGLRGAALWYDAVLSDPLRVLAAALLQAQHWGARTLHHVEAVGLQMEGKRVAGLEAMDRETGELLELHGRAVVNCAGPWCRQLAARFDRDLPELFRPLLAFNLLLDREPPSQAALAVAAPGKDAQTWFLLPCEGKILAGTYYVASAGGSGPDEASVEAFLHELNAALPGWDLRPDHILSVSHGWIPAAAEGSRVPASRPVIHDHGSSGGPQGLFSVSGVKLTTSRAVAEKTLAKVMRETPDVETSSDDYARRFAGEVGTYFLQVQQDIVLDLLTPWPGARVLDVGGGHAQLAPPLVERGFRVTVAGSEDVCRARLDRALPPGSVEFRACDLLALPFPDRSFDVVVSIRLLTHLERWREQLAEMCRVAAEAVIVDYPDSRSFNRLYGPLFSWKKAVEGNTRIYHIFAPGEIAAEAARHGFGRPVERRQYLLPMVVHRVLKSVRLSRVSEGASAAAGLTRWLGSPVLLRLERTTR